MNYLPKILLIGSHGQLGQALLAHPKASTYRLITSSHAEMDISDFQTVEAAFTAIQPDFIINAAAYTAVDQAEKEVEQAHAVNHAGAKHLAEIAEADGIPLIHLSTDYVFDGKKTLAYHEQDTANPLNVYGKSKYLGEEAIRKNCEAHIILRLSGIFSEYRTNFLKTILRLAREREILSIVNDQITCPTYAGDIASAIYQILAYRSGWGTYHFCSEVPVTWHAFATHIINEATQFETLMVKEINAISSTQFNAAAKRPANAVLNCEKLKKTFDIQQPSWEVGVNKVIETLLD